MTLGNGYSSDKGIELDVQCVKGDIVYHGASRGLFKYNEAISIYELDRLFKIELSAYAKIKLGFVKIKIKASLGYYNEVKESNYRQSHNFVINAKISERRLDITNYGTDLLTEDASLLYAKNKKEFIETCGDEFIIEEDLNVGLYFSVVFDFASKLEKHIFRASGPLSKLPLTTLLFGAELQKTTLDRYRSKASLHILQKGLDIIQLKEKLPEFAWIDNYGTLECEDISICRDISKKLFDYAAEDFVEITQDNNNVIDDGIINFNTMPYESLGLDLNQVEISAEIVAVRKKISELIDEYQEKKIFLQKLLTKNDNKYILFDSIKVGWDPENMSPGMFARLKDETQILVDEFIAELETRELDCYGGNLEDCKDFKVPEELAIINSFGHAYIIKGLCDTEVYGPRYILPIAENIYIEDTSYNTTKADDNGALESTTQELVTWYYIKRDETQIELEARIIHPSAYSETCTYISQREEGYKLIDLYNIENNVPPECRRIICPDTDSDFNVKGELIYTDTPL